MNRSTSFETYQPDTLANWALGIPEIEGVTLSGGDPFDQDLDALNHFVKKLKLEGLSVLSYTGRTLSQLQALGCPDTDALISHLDILIDGLYVESLNKGAAWRGSSNQIVHFLSDRYRHLEVAFEAEGRQGLEFEMNEENQVALTGIPEVGLVDRLAEEMGSRGFEV